MDSQIPLSERLSFLIRQVRVVADCLVREQEALLSSDLSGLSAVVESKVSQSDRLSEMLSEWETASPPHLLRPELLTGEELSSLQSFRHEISLLSELATVNMILAQESGQLVSSLVRTLTSDPGQFHTYNPSGGLGGVSSPAPTLVSTRT
ncbi:MAG: flagellar export chaperone FlgN [Nitrospiraceae bacterium]|nr:flagellar export chaperone FlgN [Nitrospiraceae bacterium]